MLLSLLYWDDQIIAAAPACEQQPYGQKYWLDQFATGVDVAVCETAVVKIDEPKLVDRLLKMTIESTFSNGHEAFQVVDEHLLASTEQWAVRYAA